MIDCLVIVFNLEDEVIDVVVIWVIYFIGFVEFCLILDFYYGEVEVEEMKCWFFECLWGFE